MSTKARQVKAFNKKVLRINKLLRVRSMKKAAARSLFSFSMIDKSRQLLTLKYNKIKFTAKENMMRGLDFAKTITDKFKAFKEMGSTSFHTSKSEEEMEMIHPIVKG